MGNSKDNNINRCILYGLPKAGKTLFLYQLQSEHNLLTKEGGKGEDGKNFEFQKTLGINYEEVKLKKKKIGIFDISGDKRNINILNLICKAVEISGVIFIIAIEEIDEIEKTKEALEIVLGNNYLMKNPKLYIIYNIKNDENYHWISTELLDSRLEINKLKKKYGIKDFHSEKVDVSQIREGAPPEGLYLFEN